MDFSILTEHFVLVVVVACLCVGYCLKHASLFKWIPNADIPIILAVLGAVLNLAVTGFTIESAVYGMAMGHASTGLHQTFKKFVEGNNTEGEE